MILRRNALGESKNSEVDRHLSRHNVAVTIIFVEVMKTDEKVSFNGKINGCLNQYGQEVQSTCNGVWNKLARQGSNTAPAG
jgi:hypothetical protein